MRRPAPVFSADCERSRRRIYAPLVPRFVRGVWSAARKKNCAKDAEKKKLCTPARARLTPKQLNSHPVVQSERPTTPIAVSVCARFDAPADPESGVSAHHTETVRRG